jgi:hypothetical protein
MNTDTLADPVIAVDFGKPLADMIAAGNYGWFNPDITVVNFPVEDTGKKRFSARLFHFGRSVSSEDAVAAIKKANFAPASLAHGLSFGAAFPE